MGKSGNPAKQPQPGNVQHGASSAADFKKKRSGVFELPSGLFMKLRNPGGLAMFMAQGIIPNSLMGVVNDAMEGKKADPAELMKASGGGVDQGMIDDMMSMMDTMVVQCAVDPKVYPVPAEPDERDDDLLYADELEDNDKMFIFQWVTGGTADLERFRQQHVENVAALAGSQEVALPPK